MLHKYARAAGVEVSPHIFRHTLATRFLRKAGADLVTVKELLGHEKLETTVLLQIGTVCFSARNPHGSQVSRPVVKSPI